METSPVTIKNLSDDEKPREKAMAHGVKSLTDTELMAIVFATGIQGKNVLDLSREIINGNGGHLSRVADLSYRQMMQLYKGIGPAKAITLLAALELGIRAARDAAQLSHSVVNSADLAVTLMREHFQRLDHEEFWVMLRNNRGAVIRNVRIASGGQTATVVDVKILMRTVLEYKATRIIVFHNHPSGNTQPSMDDDRLTRKIKGASELLDVRLDDHIIITDASYYSYNDNRRL